MAVGAGVLRRAISRICLVELQRSAGQIHSFEARERDLLEISSVSVDAVLSLLCLEVIPIHVAGEGNLQLAVVLGFPEVKTSAFGCWISSVGKTPRVFECKNYDLALSTFWLSHMLNPASFHNTES